MDRWAIVISGSGPHHSANAGDADALAADFVARLRKAGHEIISAKLSTAGAEHDVDAALDHGDDFPVLPPPPLAPRLPLLGSGGGGGGGSAAARPASGGGVKTGPDQG